MTDSDSPPPVFTIGNRAEYVAGLADTLETGELLLKLGLEMAGKGEKSPTFTGGIVFQNPKDAQRYIDEECAEEARPDLGVFEVQACWDQDCYSPGDDMYWRYLTYSRPITMLVVK